MKVFVSHFNGMEVYNPASSLVSTQKQIDSIHSAYMRIALELVCHEKSILRLPAHEELRQSKHLNLMKHLWGVFLSIITRSLVRVVMIRTDR